MKPRHPLWRLPAALALAAAALGLTACQTSYTRSSVPVATPGAAAAASEPDAQRAAKVRLELASEYLRAGRSSVALEEINHVLSIAPHMVEAYMLRGMIYADQHNFAAAEADYARVMRERGNDPDALHNYGWILCRQGRYADAEGYFDRVLAVPGYTASARTLMAKGLCQQSAGKAGAAMATLQRAYEVDPNNPIVAYNLASMLYHAGRVADAQTYLRRLNGSDLANAETLWLGIKVENALGRRDRVRELGSVLAHRFPNSREFALYERGAFYE
ncbi:type IV pilus biogenesis/stability protein PilW [Vandammella animalimorsus]|uniref:Type IV pilus biogenesis/stability protein PilW n=1 Tax=Vandammella animalimorsus TaxID=2029117 RepID=A0A2A2T2D3_9BURK|nr:type IV pilus biogenesis/stability protein PilW [Vandammella animalimorsus]PAT33651.1 type IV pilus biogenesis/stability protein PilW [Vandammella animalimorsus]PAT43211.1 type IV pilus biogenesis/stability protein PilW [Vandammella animalimorsus]PAX15608.1 type IV pilus biogenesis/stability protein PilW [Vandammella animalimorsus]PAX17605.1 type IV pilus biogenesis/stability protein PilW [Vandammella animalimorsus]